MDFTREKLGRAHHMKLGSKVLRTAYAAPNGRLACAAGPSG